MRPLEPRQKNIGNAPSGLDSAPPEYGLPDTHSPATQQRSPQNPYRSAVVSASAGSGKTYQLSNRFLCLVAAGHDPSRIVAITFSRKATAEMRSRILGDAAKLLSDGPESREFAAKVQAFYEEAKSSRAFPALPPPLSPREVAELVLSHTQRLRIQTMDGLFWEWVQRFPMEASAPLTDSDRTPLPPLFTLLEPDQIRELYDRCWNRALCRMEQEAPGALRELVNLSDSHLHQLRQTVDLLMAQEVFWWYLEVQGRQPYQTWEEIKRERCQGEGRESPIDFASQPTALNEEIVSALLSLRRELDEKYHSCLEDCFTAQSLTPLIESKLVNSSYKFSRSLIKGKRRENLAGTLGFLEEEIRLRINAERMGSLDLYGRALWSLTSLFRQELSREQMHRGVVSFSDVSRAAFRLMRQDDAMAARMELVGAIDHLMLDEFQDTSQLQWGIFGEVSREILSRSEVRHGLPGTVFIVGDGKQSIYRFRHADPRILGQAARDLSSYGVDLIPMDQSYRSAGIVLDFVNALFRGDEGIPLASFRPHSTALKPDGEGVVPDGGSLTITPCFYCDGGAQEPETSKDQNHGLAAVEKEAQFVATWLRETLAQRDKLTWDKERREWRPLELGDCAVLFHYGTHAAIFESALLGQGMSAVRVEERGFFARQEIRDLMALCRWIALPADLPSLLQVLRSGFFGTSDKDLMEQVAALDQRTEPKLPGQGVEIRVQGTVDLLMAIGGFPSRVLLPLLNRYDNNSGRTEPLSLELRRVLNACDMRQVWGTSWGATEGAVAWANAERLLAILTRLETQGRSIPLDILEELTRLAENDTWGSASADPNAVTLMTMHKSKGLEFPLVILADCARSWQKVDAEWLRWQPISDAWQQVSNEQQVCNGWQPVRDEWQGGGAGERQEPSLRYVGRHQEQRPLEDEDFDATMSSEKRLLREEAERILYVALTRARHHLFISGSLNQSEPDPIFTALTSAFQRVPLPEGSSMSEGCVGNTPGVLTITRPYVKGTGPASPPRPSFQSRAAFDPFKSLDPHSPMVRATARPWLHRVVHRSESGISPQDSARNLLAFAAQGADFQNAAQLGKREAAVRGTFVHRCLEWSAKERICQPNSLSALDWLGLWHQTCVTESATSSMLQRVDLFESGKLLVETFVLSERWQDWVGPLTLHVHAELPIVHGVGDELITGQIDLLLERSDGSFWVIDYKTIGVVDVRVLGEVAAETLLQVGRTKGYFSQIRLYMEAIAMQRQSRAVSGFIAFPGTSVVGTLHL